MVELPALLEKTSVKMYTKCLRNSLLLVTPPGFYRTMTQRSTLWRDIAHKMTELRYLSSVDRNMDLLTLSASERYLKFVDRHHDIIGAIEKKDIASYIGVTPNSLSRITRELNERVIQQPRII